MSGNYLNYDLFTWQIKGRENDVAKDNDIFIGSVHISDSDTRIYQAKSHAEKALGSVYCDACWASNPVAPSDEFRRNLTALEISLLRQRAGKARTSSRQERTSPMNRTPLSFPFKRGRISVHNLPRRPHFSNSKV